MACVATPQLLAANYIVLKDGRVTDFCITVVPCKQGCAVIRIELIGENIFQRTFSEDPENAACILGTLESVTRDLNEDFREKLCQLFSYKSPSMEDIDRLHIGEYLLVAH